jgi:Xaa-Pro aminopeptidase
MVLVELLLAALLFTAQQQQPQPAPLQEPYFQRDFTAADFAERRSRIFEDIGKNGIALIQGRADTGDLSTFRQSNEFYYLTGVESPQALLLLDGRNRRATLYLPHRDLEREKVEGRVPSAEDASLVQRLTGVDSVKPVESFAEDLAWAALRPPAPVLFTPLSPAETISRDSLLMAQSAAATDPWDGSSSREARFKQRLQKRFPTFDIRDLSPTLDAMRLVKSPKEIELIRTATRLAGMAIVEAMRSTAPGLQEFELDAAAKYIFFLNGSRGEGYASIIGGGRNAYLGHYFRKGDRLRGGDLLLMDYAPDYRYYTSDVARMWPVNGRYSEEQRQLSEFILAYRDALFRHIRPGVTSDQVLDGAADDMAKYLTAHPIKNPGHAEAARESLKFRGHFQHSVGMPVHDVGQLRGVPLRPGMIFTIDPMVWVHGEQLYMRIEDMALVTPTGVENLSAFVPSRLDEIERTIAEPGLLQSTPNAYLRRELPGGD